jgi:hypothetical protein
MSGSGSDFRLTSASTASATASCPDFGAARRTRPSSTTARGSPLRYTKMAEACGTRELAGRAGSRLLSALGTPHAGRKEPAPGRKARRDHARAPPAGPRPAQQKRGPAGLLPPPRPVPQYGEKVRPRREARAAAARPAVPAHARRSLPRPPAQAARREPRNPGSAAAPGDPRARLPGQLQPARPLRQPGPRRQRPAAPGPPQDSPAPAHQAGEHD